MIVEYVPGGSLPTGWDRDARSGSALRYLRGIAAGLDTPTGWGLSTETSRRPTSSWRRTTRRCSPTSGWSADAGDFARSMTE